MQPKPAVQESKKRRKQIKALGSHAIEQVPVYPSIIFLQLKGLISALNEIIRKGLIICVYRIFRT
jgi:hypothetical protein